MSVTTKLLLFGFYSAATLCCMFAGTAGADSEPLTRLRVKGSPQAMFTRVRDAFRVNRVRITVKNVGEVPATGVEVRAILPDGSELTLDGPSTIERNTEKTYKGDPSLTTKSRRKIRADLRCANCR